MKTRICRVLIALGMFGTIFTCQSAARSDIREEKQSQENKEAQDVIDSLRALIGSSTIELPKKIAEFNKFKKAIEDGVFNVLDSSYLKRVTDELERELEKLKLEKMARIDQARKAYLEQIAKENARYLDHYITIITRLASSESPNLSEAQKLQDNLKADLEAMRVPKNDITENLLKTLEEVIAKASKGDVVAHVLEIQDEGKVSFASSSTDTGIKIWHQKTDGQWICYDPAKTNQVWALFDTAYIPSWKVDINKVSKLIASGKVNLNSLNEAASLFSRMLQLNRYDKVTIEYIDLLLSYPGLNLFQTDSSGYTILHKLAIEHFFSAEHKEMARYVIRQILKKAPTLLNVQTNNGYTPLMMAIANFNKDVVEEFLMSGLRLDLKNPDGLDALQIAKKRAIDLREMGSNENADETEAIIKLIIDYIARKEEISAQLRRHNFPSALHKIIGDYEEGVLDQKESASI